MSGVNARSAAGLALAALALLLVAAASQVPYSPHADSEALLRLAWRFRGEPVRECRPYTPEELERLPEHMRGQEGVCERRIPPRRLEVEIDGSPRIDQVLRAAGSAGDRPISVLEEIRIAPGRHTLEIAFVPASGEEGGAREARRFELDTEIEIGSREVLLITLDEAAGAFVVRAPGSGPFTP